MKCENKALLKGLFPKVPFDPEIENIFFDFWTERSYDKGSLLLQKGQREKYFRLVLEGIQVLYLLKEGKEIVLGFYYTGHICANFRSFLAKRNSQLYIKAITPSETLNISVENYEKLSRIHPCFLDWNKECYEQYMIYSFERELDLMTLSAKEKYDKFLANCPEIYQQIPQKYLASYLNMSQETFSRIRAMNN